VPYALTDVDRANVVIELARDQPTDVYVDLLASRECLSAVKDRLRQFHARIQFADDRTGFIYASVRADRLLEVLRIAGVDAAGKEETFETEDDTAPPKTRDPQPVPAIRLPIPQVAGALDPDGPYFPAREGGLEALRAEHPEADGRGTRIALVDSGVDLLHPAFQQVINLEGHRQPKVVDIGTRASTSQTDSDWVRFGRLLNPVNHRISFRGRTWTVPPGGPYRIGIFARRFSLGYSEQGGFKIGNPEAERFTIHVGVLWDPQRRVVWVDTDGDLDFRNNRPLSDYTEHQDIDWFGSKVGDHDNRIPFGVKIIPSSHTVYLAIGSFHGTQIAGTAAANRLTGGLFDGAAPMAQLIDINDSSHPLLQLAYAARRADVDVINRSGGYASLGYPEEDHQRLFVERFITAYNKPVVCVCDAQHTISVWSYQSAEMLRRNRQTSGPYADAANGYVKFNADGLDTSIVAPSTSLTTLSRYQPLIHVGNDGRTQWMPGTFDSPAPTGYMISSNPSPAISYVSGVVASVVGLARAHSVRFDAPRVAKAALIGAQLLPEFPTKFQGHGRIDAAGMWNQLQDMAKADDPANPMLTSFEVSKDSGGERLPVSGYSEDFAAASATPQQRDIWITRRGGYPGNRPYRLALRGDSGVFGLVEISLDLPRDSAVRVPLIVTPTENFEVAYLRLIDGPTNVTMEEIPLMTRAPAQIAIVAPGVRQLQSLIAPRRVESQHFEVDPHAQAVAMSVEIPEDCEAQVPGGPTVWGADYQRVRFASVDTAGPPVDPIHHVGPIRHCESILTGDLSGLWTVAWDNRGAAEYETPYDPPAPDIPIAATLTVSEYAVALNDVDGSRIELHNELAAVRGRVECLTGKTAERNLTGSGRSGYASWSVQIPLGAAVWQFAVRARTPDTRAHVFALHCTAKNECSVEKQIPLVDIDVNVSIDAPQAGQWRIAILSDDGALPHSYAVKQVALEPQGQPDEFSDFAHDATVSVSVPTAVPKKTALNTSIYAGFRMAPVGDQKQGVLIALTPLSKGEGGMKSQSY
jgi:hypothetical protein